MSTATPSATPAQREKSEAAGRDALVAQDRFADRHIGPRESDVAQMLSVLGLRSLEELSDAALPQALRLRVPLATGPAASERDALRELAGLAAENQVWRSFLGLGYSDCVTPPVIQRNVLENPGWYTQYTPYQPEISQGRLEALLAYQTMVLELTGLEIANASMLDEGTAAAEAMSLCLDVCKDHARKHFFVAADCFFRFPDIGYYGKGSSCGLRAFACEQFRHGGHTNSIAFQIFEQINFRQSLIVWTQKTDIDTCLQCGEFRIRVMQFCCNINKSVRQCIGAADGIHLQLRQQSFRLILAVQAVSVSC